MTILESINGTLDVNSFINFVNSPSIQDILFPIKLVFILFAAFFFCVVIYFYFESSYLQYQFLEDVTEFFSWRAYGFRDLERRLKSIMKNTASGTERGYKLAVVEAEEFLYKTLEDAGYEGETFEDLITSAKRRIRFNEKEILIDHTVRNSIVYDVNYRLDTTVAKKILADYESLIKNIAIP